MVVGSGVRKGFVLKIAVFDTHSYEQKALEIANLEHAHELVFLEPRLNASTAILARGFPAVCSFVNDRVDEETLMMLAQGGTSIVALRSAGFNHVDIVAAAALEMTVVRVPEYSPYAVAEHAVALLLTLNRKIHRAYSRVRDGNFSLEGLVGFDLHAKTVGVIGTGKIGAAFCRIMHGFGCNILAHDLSPNEQLVAECSMQYVALEQLYTEADVLSLHVPLTTESRHMIDAHALKQMKSGVMLINTSRGGLIDTPALIGALKSGTIGAAGLDVYEEEAAVFFEDHSDDVLQDDVLARLLTFPNVLITSHQGFLTREALRNISMTTLSSIGLIERSEPLPEACVVSVPAKSIDES